MTARTNHNQPHRFPDSFASIITHHNTATDKNKKSKYLYLGKAGSEAHLDAVEKVARRGLIDELERVINSLQESYLDVCFGGETEPDPSYYPEGLKEE